MRLRLRSRLQVRVRGVGAGGKTLLFQQRGNGLIERFLVVLDGKDGVASAIEDDLLRGLDLGMQGIGYDGLSHHIELGEQFPRRRDFVALARGAHAAQPSPALHANRADQFTPCA